MGLLSLLRRKSPVRSRADLATFLDRHAAFMVQKCIFEYARARSGVLSPKLFKEARLQGGDRRRALAKLPALPPELRADGGARAAPDGGGAGAGDARRPGRRGRRRSAGAIRCLPAWSPTSGPARRSGHRRSASGKPASQPSAPVKDIPHETAKEFFDGLPIHSDLTSFDFELVTNNLRVQPLPRLRGLRRGRRTSRRSLAALASGRGGAEAG